MREIAGKEITTVEGIDVKDCIQFRRAWMQINVPQCGYCQVGQIHAGGRSVEPQKRIRPTKKSMKQCPETSAVCGTYQRIRGGD